MFHTTTMLSVIYMVVSLHLHSISKATSTGTLKEEACPFDKEANDTATNQTETLPCFCHVKSIFCKNLDSIPTFSPLARENKELWKGLYLPSQRISSIPKLAFLNLPVRVIVLNVNPIGNNISSNAFSGLEYVLQEVQLGGCNISKLPTRILRGLGQLRALHLWNNSILEIPDLFFKDNLKLKDLSMWGNNISAINGNTFAGLWNLTSLNLDNNKLHKIPSSAFRHLSKLELLRLSGNQIDVLTSDMFENVPKLKVLDLSRNGIVSVHTGAFHHLSKLEILNLEKNQIEIFTSMPFRNLYNLSSLYLNDNKLSMIWVLTFSGLYSLQTLNLANNPLIRIPDFALKHSTMLRYVNLDHNNLRSLSRCVFYKRLPLHVLSLVGNPLMCNCDLSWLATELAQNGARVWGTCAFTPVPDKDSIWSAADKAVYEPQNCPSKKVKCNRNE